MTIFLILAALILGLIFYSYAVEPHRIRQVDYHLHSEKWPSAYKPLKIAVASDIHAGCPSVCLGKLDGLVKRLNNLNADIILLPGDFLIDSVFLGNFIHPEPIAEVLGRLKAPRGVYAVLGNHEWVKDAKAMGAALEKVGIRVLENHALKINHDEGQEFWVAGLADETKSKPDIAATMAQITDENPVIMMCHDPATFHKIDHRPVVTIAGHTHGGQVSLPFFGPLIAPRKYHYGHIVEEGRNLIVSSGVGTSVFPIRFNMLPEILLVTVRGPAVA